LGNVSIDFASLTPYWGDSSTACGKATLAGNTLGLTYNSPCATSTIGGEITLDTTHWRLCGDFDIQVDFDFTQFPVPADTVTDLFATIRAFDPAGADGIAMEQFSGAKTNCDSTPARYYQAFAAAAINDCSTIALTTDTSGKMRIVRSGSTVSGYYWSPAGEGGVDGGGTWSQLVSAPGMTTGPWSLQFFSGNDNKAASSTLDLDVSFSGLSIMSANTP
jgi:hypothetical protein